LTHPEARTGESERNFQDFSPNWIRERSSSKTTDQVLLLFDEVDQTETFIEQTA
jgi:hypothetical protein